MLINVNRRQTHRKPKATITAQKCLALLPVNTALRERVVSACTFQKPLDYIIHTSIAQEGERI